MKSDITPMDCFRNIESLDDDASLTHYGRDWTRFWPAQPSVILFPKNTSEVAEIVAVARQQRLKLVPSGGRTGLSGRAGAAHGEVVVALAHMRRRDGRG